MDSYPRIPGKRFRLLSLAATLTGLLACQLAQAAPAIGSVAGSASHGELISISGNSFGTRSSYNNIGDTWKSGSFINFRFKDFEDNKLNSDGFFPQKGGSTWTPGAGELYLANGGPTNSTHYMRRMYTSGESGGLSAEASGAGNQFYSTFKFMLDPNTQSGKFFRFYANSPQNNIYLSTGGSGTTVRGYSECTASSCSPETEWGAGPSFQSGKWHRVEVFADASTNTFSVWVDGTMSWTQRDWLATNLGLNNHTLDYPNMIDGPSRGYGSAGAYSYDDIYIDFTQARVELSDSPTWAGAKRREVQIPVSWSAGLIDVRVNAGAFASGQQAYLYVVDPQGQVNSQGYPVTLGQVTVRPHPPSGFNIQ